ncbi:hypothetical protein DV736_g6572, partial [Chaetothyriales sp. CBS 134916]
MDASTYTFTDSMMALATPTESRRLGFWTWVMGVTVVVCGDMARYKTLKTEWSGKRVEAENLVGNEVGVRLSSLTKVVKIKQSTSVTSEIYLPVSTTTLSRTPVEVVGCKIKCFSKDKFSVFGHDTSADMNTMIYVPMDQVGSSLCNPKRHLEPFVSGTNTTIIDEYVVISVGGPLPMKVGTGRNGMFITDFVWIDAEHDTECDIMVRFELVFTKSARGTTAYTVTPVIETVLATRTQGLNPSWSPSRGDREYEHAVENRSESLLALVTVLVLVGVFLETIVILTIPAQMSQEMFTSSPPTSTMEPIQSRGILKMLHGLKSGIPVALEQAECDVSKSSF